MAVNVAVATIACLNLPATNKYGMNSSGTSLIPAATPMPTPFHLLSSSRVRSATTSTSSRGSIWPRNKAFVTGSSQSATPPTARAMAILPMPRLPIAPSVSQAVSAIAARLNDVISQRNADQLRWEVAAKTMPANGV